MTVSSNLSNDWQLRSARESIYVDILLLFTRNRQSVLLVVIARRTGLIAFCVLPRGPLSNVAIKMMNQ